MNAKNVDGKLENVFSFGADNYENDATAKSSYMSTGTVVNAVNEVCSDNPDRIKYAFCNIRPPGHHSKGRSDVAGFCFINNVAIATIHALKTYPDKIKKVCIFDWDVH